MLNQLNLENWIQLYIYWELSLIKELGYEINLLNMKNSNLMINNSIVINNKSFEIPKILVNKDLKVKHNKEIREALTFNKNLLIENFILPNKLRFPLFRNILENYYT